jgi:hypothetical protein
MPSHALGDYSVKTRLDITPSPTTVAHVGSNSNWKRVLCLLKEGDAIAVVRQEDADLDTPEDKVGGCTT